jgi:hypothetical protein
MPIFDKLAASKATLALGPLASSSLQPMLDQYAASQTVLDQLVMLDAHFKANAPASAQPTWSRRGRVLFQCYMVVLVTVVLMHCELSTSPSEQLVSLVVGPLGLGGANAWWLAGVVYDRVIGRPPGV